MTAVVRAEISFPLAGNTIAGTLYRPGVADARVACVVMGHGFTLTRRDGIPEYAERFAAAGLAVLAFDYRHWGDSTGQPRRWVSLHEQLADWQAAVDHARGLDGVDPDRIAVWGMSMGGGHALLTAARDPRIAAVVALVPSTDPLAAQPPLKIGMRMIGRGLRETITRSPVRMPAAGPPGSFAIVAAPEALSGFERLTAGGDAGVRSARPPRFTRLFCSSSASTTAAYRSALSSRLLLAPHTPNSSGTTSTTSPASGRRTSTSSQPMKSSS